MFPSLAGLETGPSPDLTLEQDVRPSSASALFKAARVDRGVGVSSKSESPRAVIPEEEPFWGVPTAPLMSGAATRHVGIVWRCRDVIALKKSGVIEDISLIWT